MTRAIVRHTQPTVTLSLTVNIALCIPLGGINADKTLLLFAGLVWLACIGLRRAYEIGRAVVVVAWRRIKRALRRLENRIEWSYSGLAYGPVMGVG